MYIYVLLVGKQERAEGVSSVCLFLVAFSSKYSSRKVTYSGVAYMLLPFRNSSVWRTACPFYWAS